MRGVISAAGYVPHHRLDRSEIAAFFGAGGGRGTRAVASYDEDTTTMGLAAADLALRSGQDAPGALWFATSAPAYLEKTNAAAVHAALRLDQGVGALDFGGAIRSGIGALRTALTAAGSGSTLVVAADIRDGLATGADEAAAGDGAAAVLVGDDSDGPVLAEYLGGTGHTVEITERWRMPGGARSQSWEERLGAHVYPAVAAEAFGAALADSGLDGAADISNASGFGAHLVAGGTGIFVHDRGIGFSLVPGHPAEYAPGRRPPHTLSPALVTNPDGSLRQVLGTMGGDSQPQILLQLLARTLGLGQSPGAAIRAPRWVVGPDDNDAGFATWRPGPAPPRAGGGRRHGLARVPGGPGPRRGPARGRPPRLRPRPPDRGDRALHPRRCRRPPSPNRRRLRPLGGLEAERVATG